MASIYEKRNPGNNRVFWGSRVKVGDEWLFVALQMEVIDNKRDAQRRADILEREAQTGRLSESTLEWMGPKSFAKLQLKVGKIGARATADTSIDSWDSAWRAYLSHREAKDTKDVPQGKSKAENKTLVTVHYATKTFKEWCVARTGGKFLDRTWTELLIEYIRHRKEAGMASTTLWNRDYSYNCLWGEYLAGRGLCEKPNRDMIRAVLPEKWATPILTPKPADDLACLEWLYQHRHDHKRDTIRRGKNAIDMRCGKTYRARHSAWCLVLLVRGLGCRPSEATALDWATVDLGRSWVRFVKSKNRLNRTVPVIYQWVHDGLRELWEDRGRPTSGAVVLTCNDSVYRNDNAASDLLTVISKKNGFPCLYHLKKAQKCWHEQTIRVGFRPWDVAKWADHSVSVQEAHYAGTDTYLPLADGPFDYRRFGELSEYGKLCMTHFGLKLPALTSNKTE